MWFFSYYFCLKWFLGWGVWLGRRNRWGSVNRSLRSCLCFRYPFGIPLTMRECLRHSVHDTPAPFWVSICSSLSTIICMDNLSLWASLLSLCSCRILYIFVHICNKLFILPGNSCSPVQSHIKNFIFQDSYRKYLPDRAPHLSGETVPRFGHSGGYSCPFVFRDAT